MIKIVDKRCDLCNRVYENVLDDADNVCKCGGNLQRLFSYNKRMQMLPHWAEHFTHEPVYVEDREDFDKKCKKYGVYARSLKKPKTRQYFI